MSIQQPSIDRLLFLRAYDLLSCVILTRFTVPDINSFLQRRPQIQCKKKAVDYLPHTTPASVTPMAAFHLAGQYCKVHCWESPLRGFSSPAACVGTPSTMETSQQRGSFQVSSRFISLCSVLGVCAVFGNMASSSSSGDIQGNNNSLCCFKYLWGFSDQSFMTQYSTSGFV